MIGTKMFVPAAAVAFFIGATSALAQTDPGVQGGAARAGGPLAGLTANERNFFQVGLEDIEEAEVHASISMVAAAAIASRPSAAPHPR